MNSERVTHDIETSTRVGLFFGPTYKPHIGKVIQESYVFGFGWKPYHKKVQSCWIWDFPLYKKDPTNDIEVVKKWLEVVASKDIVIGQNSRSFDDKLMMGRVIIHKLPPPEPFHSVDTMADTKQVARYDSHKLDDVSEQYGHGKKMDTGGIELWWECLDIPGFKKGNPKFQRKMKKYCERDVILTEQRYDRELPYYKRHPAMNILEQKPTNCPRCTSPKLTAGMKYHSTKYGAYQYWRCLDCSYVPRVRYQSEYTKRNKVKFV